jgi:prepilin-type processing-associated H-X9-DG protein
MGNNRGSFWCPSAPPDSKWDTNLNKTMIWLIDWNQYGAKASGTGTRFSYAYNDWGIGPVTRDLSQQLGLGGDINPPAQPEMPESRIKRPADMIMLSDSRTDGSWDGNMDPKQSNQWPAKRHDQRCNLMFGDGHAEAAIRKDVVNPQSEKWRRRWNNDNEPHWEYNWAGDSGTTPD